MQTMHEEPTTTVHSETGRLPPAENIPEKVPAPQEIAAAAVASISQAAKQMAQEADAAASAIEAIAKMIRQDADDFKREVGRLDQAFGERVATYLSECAAIATSFQVKKENMIKAAQMQGPLVPVASQ